jgi:hypothetical protein
MGKKSLVHLGRVKALLSELLFKLVVPLHQIGAHALVSLLASINLSVCVGVSALCAEWVF